jgi:hypothetical protein
MNQELAQADAKLNELKKTERFDDEERIETPVILADHIELPRAFAGRRAAAMEAMTNACCGD